MKKLILTIAVAAFTVGSFASEAANKDSAAPCSASTVSTCPASKSQCSAATAAAKKNSAKKVVHSPKGAQQANKA